MRRLALVSVLLTVLLVVQGGAYAAVSGPTVANHSGCEGDNSSNDQSTFPASVFASSDDCSDESATEQSNGSVDDTEDASSSEQADPTTETTSTESSSADTTAESSATETTDSSSADETTTEGDASSDSSSSDSSSSDSSSSDSPEDSEATTSSETTLAESASPSVPATSSEETTASGATTPGAGGTSPAGGAPSAGGTSDAGQAPGGTTPGGAAPSGGQTPGGAAPGASSTAAAGAGQGQQGAGAASPDADFEVIRSSTDAPVGGTGTLTVVIENQGEDAENAIVDLQSQSSALTFGGAASTSQFVGEWDEGDRETIEVDVTASGSAGQRSYPIQATISYEDDDGNQSQSAPLSFGVTPGDEQEFSLDDVDSSLSVGTDGTVSGTITNNGPETATEAVLVFAANASDVAPRQSEVVLGDIDSGESVDFEYPFAVAQGTPPGDRQLPFIVQYQNGDGEPQQSGTLNAQVTIGENTDDFEVVSVDSDLQPGEQGTVEVTLENTGEDATDTSINLQSLSASVLFGETANASQFVGDWDEGDRKTIEVQATAAQGTTEGEYPMQASVSYTDGDNEPKQAGPFTFGVEVGENTDDLEVVGVDSDLEPGERGTVSVRIENTGEDATDATVNLQSLTGAILFGESANASQFVGDWDEGETKTVELQATAAQGTTVGEYSMQASASYTDGDNQPVQTGPVVFGVEVGESRDDFEVVSVDSTVPVGDQGTVRVTLNNTDENATGAIVSLQSLSGDLLLGQTANATQFVGAWDQGETRTVEFEVTASNETDQRSYPFQTSVSYTDTSNQQAQAGPYSFGVTPLREQAFTLENATGNLSVGDEGTVSGTIVNEGPQSIDNAVVSLTVNNQNINVQQEEVAIGSLEAGESTNFSFPIEVSDNGEAGQQQFSFVVEYDNQAGDPRESETLDTQVDIGPAQDAFTVTRQNATLAPGGTQAVTLEVTNNRNSVVRNVEAQAFTNDPLSLADDQAFISRLGPGESANITFEVSATGEALPSTYPLSLDFQYETPDGDTRLTDTYEVPVQIEEQSGGLLSSLGGGDDGGFPPWILILIVLLVAAGLGYVLYQRQSGDSSQSGSTEANESAESGDAAEPTDSTGD